MWQRIRALLFGKTDNTGAVHPGAHPGIVDVGDAIVVQVACNRCHEVLSVRLRKSSDIQRNYDDTGPAYFVRKIVVGQRCFNRIELELEMDARYRPIDVRVQGGKLHAGEEGA